MDDIPASTILPASIPRVELASLPTPLEFLPRLTAHLGGPEIYMKRDDISPLALGGNKTRKLEFLLGEALAQHADTVITVGSYQSNHCRQTAAAAARLGLRCVLVLGGEGRRSRSGNYLLDVLLGAEIIDSGEEDRDTVYRRVIAQERDSGRCVYPIPYGGASPVGEIGFVHAMAELAHQMHEQDIHADAILLPTASGGTQAGLLVGSKFLNLETKIIGVSIEKERQKMIAGMLQLAHDTADLLGLDLDIHESDFLVHDEYKGKGYGIIQELELECLQLLARKEGILVDPVYTGRAFAGMVDLIRRGFFQAGEKLIFWHTGGLPALFVYEDALLPALVSGSSRLQMKSNS